MVCFSINSVDSDGWVQIIRGPRPPAEIWQRQELRVSAAQPKATRQNTERSVTHRVVGANTSGNPDAAREIAQCRVSRLEKLLEAM